MAAAGVGVAVGGAAPEGSAPYRREETVEWVGRGGEWRREDEEGRGGEKVRKGRTSKEGRGEAESEMKMRQEVCTMAVRRLLVQPGHVTAVGVTSPSGEGSSLLYF